MGQAYHAQVWWGWEAGEESSKDSVGREEVDEGEEVWGRPGDEGVRRAEETEGFGRQKMGLV